MKKILWLSILCTTTAIIAGPQVIIDNSGSQHPGLFTVETTTVAGSTTNAPFGPQERITYDTQSNLLRKVTIVHYDPNGTKTKTFLIPDSKNGEGWTWIYTIKDTHFEEQGKNQVQTFAVLTESIHW